MDCNKYPSYWAKHSTTQLVLARNDLIPSSRQNPTPWQDTFVMSSDDDDLAMFVHTLDCSCVEIGGRELTRIHRTLAPPALSPCLQLPPADLSPIKQALRPRQADAPELKVGRGKR